MIDPKKITNYLLTDAPDAGAKAKGKSKFFRGIGFDFRQPSLVLPALLMHPQTEMLIATDETPYGTRYIYECELSNVPNGGSYCIRSVWQRRPDGHFWLATAFPA